MASDIIKTFGLMFKLEGVDDVKKTLDEFDKRISNITRQTVDKIKVDKENLRVLREQVKVVGERAKASVSVERAKQATLRTEQATIRKDQAGWKFRINRENEKIKRERALEREKIKRAKEESRTARIQARTSGGRSGGSGGITGAIWRAGGGLMALKGLANLALTGASKLMGVIMDVGQQGVAIQRITEGAKDPEKLRKTVSNLEQSGWMRGLGRGQMVSFVAQLKQAFDEAFRLKKEDSFFESWGLGGAKFNDFETFLYSLIAKGKTPQQQTAIRNVSGANEAEALLNYQTFKTDVFSEIESQVKAMGELNSAMNKLQMEIAKVAPELTKFSVMTFQKIGDGLEWFSSSDGQTIVKSLSAAMEGFIAGVELLVSTYAKILGLIQKGSDVAGKAGSDAYLKYKENQLNTATEKWRMDLASKHMAAQMGVPTSGAEYEQFKRKLYFDYKKSYPTFPESEAFPFSKYLWERAFMRDSEDFAPDIKTNNNNQTFNFNINVNGGTMTNAESREIGYAMATAFNELANA